jgi:hypothetical protein
LPSPLLKNFGVAQVFRRLEENIGFILEKHGFQSPIIMIDRMGIAIGGR